MAALILSGAWASTQASAANISNRDDKDQKITIIEGAASADHLLKPQQTLEKVCLKGCVVRLNESEDDEYQLEADDIVSIEDGYLYHDTPDASPAAQTTVPPAAQSAPGAAPPKQ